MFHRLRRPRTVLVGVLLFSVGACDPTTTPERALTTSDIAAVDSTLAAYRKAWIANDREGVLNTLAEDITLFVPGRTASNVHGRDALASFWFPSSDTAYAIRTYEISDQQIHGSGAIAIVQGRSVLAVATVVGDSAVASTTSTSDFLTVMRNDQGRWRIFRQMYVLR